MAEFEAAPTGFSHLLQSIGSWGRPSGRGLYMFRSMIVASSTATLLGLATAVAGGVLVSSGSLGFLVGSCVGFVGASIHYYKMSLAQALIALEEEPRLMQLHLVYNFPWLGFQRLRREQLMAGWWRSNWIRQGNLIAAYQSASVHLDEIHDRRAQGIVERAVRDGYKSSSAFVAGGSDEGRKGEKTGKAADDAEDVLLLTDRTI